MNDDDFLLDEEDDIESQEYVTSSYDDEDADEEGIDEDSEELASGPALTEEDYNGKMTKNEIYLSSAYDDIMASAKKNQDRVSTGSGRLFDGSVVDAVRIVLQSAPKNTAVLTVERFVQELFQTQGHNRIPSSVYVPDQPIRSADLDDEFGGTDDSGFNEKLAEDLREHIARFVAYLSGRDLSKDSITSMKRKQRQLPAFIIFLFSSGMYDLILNCETLPEEYAVQVSNAFKRIQKQKYDIVEALATRYEEHGRYQVAERVRKMGLDWFSHEPAEIRTLASFRDLDLTYQDIVDYRDFRSRFVNASKTITQDLISDYIEVVMVPGKVYEKLKDKTRSDAIADVKQVYKEWTRENPIDSELADKIIWKDLNYNK